MISKWLLAFTLGVVICTANLVCGYAQCYSLCDFENSGLFPDQFGNTGFTQDDGTEVFARFPGSYHEINEAFPGAIEFSYPQSFELRKLIFRREITDRKRAPENSELLYSYWPVSTGIFCVIWREAYIMSDGSDYVAGVSFFVSLENKETDPSKSYNVKTLCSANNFAFSLESIHFPNAMNWLTGKYSRLICGQFTTNGLKLKCYLIKSDGSVVMDITWLYGWKLMLFEDYFNRMTFNAM